LIENDPRFLTKGIPDFNSTISLSDALDLNNLSFVPFVSRQTFSNEGNKEVSGLLMVFSDTENAPGYIYADKEGLQDNPELYVEVSEIGSLDVTTLNADDFLYFMEEMVPIVNCENVIEPENEVLERGLLKDILDTLTDCGTLEQKRAKIKRLIENWKNRPRGGRTDDHFSPGGPSIIYVSNHGLTGPGFNTNPNPGSSEDPNYINNRDELFNCLGFDSFDDNTSPPHPNVELCTMWMNYYENCIQKGENLDVPNYFQAAQDWARHMTLNRGTFQDVLDNTLFCVEEGKFECVDQVSKFVNENNLNWSLYEQRQFVDMLNSGCGSELGLEDKFIDLIASFEFSKINAIIRNENVPEELKCLAVEKYAIRKNPRLRPAELALINENWYAAWEIEENVTVTDAEMIRIFGSHQDNACSNAFRHALFNALNAQDVGADLAKQFGDAHEDIPGNTNNNAIMDFHNNAVGIIVGSRISVGPSIAPVVSAICAELAAGNLLVLVDPTDITSATTDSSGCSC